MNAVILAAGQGSRLAERSNELPKCLLRFGDSSIIEHQVASLRACGVREIHVVVGYRAASIERMLGQSVRYIRNDLFRQTNSLYSLWLARHRLGNGFVLMNGDVLFHPDILQRLLCSSHADAIAFQRKTQFDDEEMKVQLNGDRVLTISKALSRQQSHGESLGLAKVSSAGSEVLIQAMRHLIVHGGAQNWAPRAFDVIAPHYPLFGYDVGALPWTEIDFPQDLDVATTVVWPRICASAYAAA